MAHFAKIENGIVTQVIVVHNNDAPNEAAGIAFLEGLYGPGITWKQTHYDGSLRKNYAGLGYAFDAGRDAFIPPKPYPSWVLNEKTACYKAPKDMPTDSKKYEWDESIVNWKTLP